MARSDRVRTALRRLGVNAAKRTLIPWHRFFLYKDHWRLSQAAVEAWNPEVVHSCDLDGLVGAGRAARRLGIPHVHDCHELFLERPLYTNLERFILGRIEKRAIRNPRSVTVVNESIATELRKRYGIKPTVIRNCAEITYPLKTVDLRPLAGLPPYATVVLYQGGFLRGRGLPELVRSVDGYPDGVFLVLLGWGSQRPELEVLVRELQLGERVRFVDAVPPDDLLALTASATIGVIPYQPVGLNNRLALPNKIFEYLAVGVPVASADIPELHRIVVGSECGRVFDPYDPDSIALAVTALLEPQALARAGEAARRFGRTNTWANERSLFLDTYARMLSAHSPSWNGQASNDGKEVLVEHSTTRAPA